MSVLNIVALLITAVAAGLAFGRGRIERGIATWLRQALAIVWTAGAVIIVTEQEMSTAVGMAAFLDLFVGFVAVVISTIDPTRLDARIVGGVSISLMPAHWIVSMGQGLSDTGWIVYAATCNGAFVVQCLVTGGWLDGMGRGVSRFLSRIRGLPFLRFRGR